MAQDFERSYASSISNSSGSPTTLVTSNSDDALISIRLVNKHTASVNVSVIITSSSTDYNVIKDAPVPAGGTLELLSGNKVVLQATDVLKIDADVASKIDATLSIMEIT